MRLFPRTLASLLTASAMLATAQRPAAHRASASTADPVAVFDTTAGRMTCRLYAKQAPGLVGNFIALAEGTKEWTDPLTLHQVQGKPFYDATALAGITDGIRGGDRFGGGEGAAGPSQSDSLRNNLKFDRPGLLAAATHQGEISSSFFLITLHADAEFDENKRGTVFGQCDDAAVQVAAKISHELLAVANRPKTAIAINHISIVRPGQPMPPVAADVPAASVQPQPVAPVLFKPPSPEPTGPTATIDTTMGPLTCRLFSKEAPVATKTFTELAEGTRSWTNPDTHATTRKPYYNGLHFNRLLPDFMIQQQDYPDGASDAGFHYSIETVQELTFDRPGRLAMANSGPTSNDSSFFVTLQPAPSLDIKFTIFGQCDDASVKLADTIAHLPRNAHNRPDKPVVIKNVTIQR